MDTTTATYSVPEENLKALTDRLDKLGRRAAKLGVGEITYTVGQGEDVGYFRTHDGRKVKSGAGKDPTFFIRYFPVTVTGTVPRLAGWAFVATLQHLEVDGETANLLKVVPGFREKLPEQFRTAKAENCDHCHKVIKTRKETFVVSHEDGISWMQVGRNCTQDFLHGVDPHDVAKLMEYLQSAADAGEESEYGGGDGGSRNTRFGLKAFLGFVAACVRLDGWTSRGKARATDGVLRASADQALIAMFPDMNTMAFARDHQPTAEDYAIVEKALTYAQDDLEAKKNDNDYMFNLWVACNQVAIDYKAAGITASLIPHYLKEVERVVVREAELKKAAASVFVGTVTKREAFRVTVASTLVVGEFNQFGPSTLHKMFTSEGNLLVWFMSGTENALAPGKTYDIKATVKKHEERAGVKQTVVTRCSAKEVLATEAAA